MALDILAAVVLGGIVFITFMVHVTGRWRKRDDPDTGTALLEFGMSFPGEAVRSVVTTADRKTRFFRLVSGNTGFLHGMERHNVARLIEPGTVLVEAIDGEPALRIDFRESAFPARVYHFESQADAAEVSLWLIGTMALAASGAAARDGARENAGSGETAAPIPHVGEERKDDL